MNRKYNWHWTTLDTIRTHYPYRTAYQVGALLGLPASVVASKANEMGIKKAPGFYQSHAYKISLSKEGKGQFKKGQVSHNKGKPMSDELKAKFAHTWFKKGHEPHNTKHDGYTRISKDGYQEIRIAKGKFMFLHRKVWEEVNGPVPPGHALVFKDGNKLNCAIENLDVLSRAQLMQRNTIHHYPDELKGVIRALSSLKKTIKRNEEQTI